jgi:hypothetical protein
MEWLIFYIIFPFITTYVIYTSWFYLHDYHYTTTPKLALDGLTPKAVTASDNMTLKTYSVRLLLTL